MSGSIKLACIVELKKFPWDYWFLSKWAEVDQPYWSLKMTQQLSTSDNLSNSQWTLFNLCSSQPNSVNPYHLLSVSDNFSHLNKPLSTSINICQHMPISFGCGQSQLNSNFFKLLPTYYHLNDPKSTSFSLIQSPSNQVNLIQSQSTSVNLHWSHYTAFNFHKLLSIYRNHYELLLNLGWICLPKLDLTLL